MSEIWKSLFSDVTIGGVSTSLIAAFLYASAGFLLSRLLSRFSRWHRNFNINRLLGLSGTKIYIIYPAVPRPDDRSYHYIPSCDLTAARKVAALLERTGRKEPKDFEIIDGHQALLLGEELWEDYDLIFIGSPKYNLPLRNFINRVSGRAHTKYLMKYNESKNEIMLEHKRIGRPITSSRDDTEHAAENPQYDYGLILSTYSHHRPTRRVVVLAGIHAAGTLGASLFISNRKKRNKLRKDDNGIVEHVIKVSYPRDKPDDIRLDKLELLE